MEPPRPKNNLLTQSQQKAVEARGNVLVMAGAGTGKTRTLVARCLDCLERDRASLDELLIVTFTEAAAAELRQRLRRAIEEKVASESINFWQEQLARFDIAHIGTLHSFCLRLVREHFHELGLDPQLAILDEGEARQLAGETLDEQFQAHYAGEDDFSLAVQNLIQIHGGGRDEKIRALILRLHHYSQTRPDAAGWLAKQVQKFSATEPADWQRWLIAAIKDWRDEWLPVLENLKGGNEKAAELTGILSRLKNNFTRELSAEILEQIVSADLTANYPKGKAGKLRPLLGNIFEEAKFLSLLAAVKNGSDPLVEDWIWVRGHMETLLRLAQEFAEKFSEHKRNDGVLDFHDLEQFALKLLWDFSAHKPTGVAEVWREKLRFVFVDEYQDINAAQDKIIAALARDFSPSPLGGERAEVRGSELANNLPPYHGPLLLLEGEGNGKQTQATPIGNRFLVGDVKQSIYRFRLADPKIFRDYAGEWLGESGQVIPLSENFRSRELLLGFANSVFSLLMREEIGGVSYGEDAKLRFGSPETRVDFSLAKDSSPRTELLLRFKTGRDEARESDAESGADELADLGETEKEARLLVMRLKQLQAERHEIWDDEEKKFRASEWRDMAVLLRAMSGKSEIYAMEFERADVPLVIARGGFYESSEISDLLSLLRLLDNPLQDVPCIAVLRSPLVGLSLDELAEIRLAAKDKHFWMALARSAEHGGQNAERTAKTSKFLERFARWRKLAKQNSLSECLEAVLAETLYADWLRAQPRGAQRAANIGRFLNLAQSFDQFQRQGLFRFLKFIEAQQEAEAEPEVPAVATENAVRLMSIHQSKGLEFPVVVLPDLAKKFNEQDQHGEIIFDEEFGLCPKVKPPHAGRRYPSLPHWLAQRRQKRELRGEELRLLYVALTRARDTLILSATITKAKWEALWSQPEPVTIQKIADAKSFADWLGIWFPAPGSGIPASSQTQGETPLLRWRLVDDAELAAPEKAESGKRKAETELPALDRATAEKLRAILNWEYPQQVATRQKAKASVTELRRTAEELDEEAEQVFIRPSFARKKRKSQIANRKLSAAEYGTAHHKFLQHFTLEKSGEFAAEAERLVRENYLSADERAILDLKAVATFWNSEPGKKILANAETVRRELAFTARFSPAEIAEIKGGKLETGLDDEFIVVQGVADLVVLLPEEIWLVDFKTDEVRADNLPVKTKLYAPQLKLYAGALAKIYSRPVTHCWLHFLSAQKTVKI